MNFAIVLLVIIIGILALLFLPRLVLISRWYHYFDGYQFSVQEFYQAVEQEVSARKVPNVSVSRIAHAERNILSSQREYLQIQSQDLVFEIGGAHFGTGSFVSWWMYKSTTYFEEKFTQSSNKNKVLFEAVFQKARHQVDKADVFKECISISVNSAIEVMTTAKGQRALSELERRPIGAV